MGRCPSSRQLERPQRTPYRGARTRASPHIKRIGRAPSGARRIRDKPMLQRSASLSMRRTGRSALPGTGCAASAVRTVLPSARRHRCASTARVERSTRCRNGRAPSRSRSGRVLAAASNRCIGGLGTGTRAARRTRSQGTASRAPSGVRDSGLSSGTRPWMRPWSGARGAQANRVRPVARCSRRARSLQPVHDGLFHRGAIVM